jgi:cytohesin
VKDEALLRRVEDGDLHGVRALLGEGASADARDAGGFTPLMLAVIHDHPAIVDVLITRGAAVNARNRAGLTPLMLAAINDNPDVARTLLAHGADVTSRTAAGWTALTYAAWRGHARMARLLLAAGADPNATDREGWTILRYASWRVAEPEAADDLVDALGGAAPGRAGAAGPGHADVIAVLRKAGAHR